MKPSTKWMLLGLAGVLAVAMIVMSGGDGPIAERNAVDQPADEGEGVQADEAKPEVIGGVRRPAADLDGPNETEHASEPAKDADPNDPLPAFGTVPAVAPDANPQVAKVVRAARDGKHPEMFSAAIAPKAFNLVAYQSDPETYLQTPEPGRVFQPAQPGPNVPVLQPLSSAAVSMVQGEAVRLQVLAPAGMPVAFTSLDLGFFSNQLSTITVAADDQGVATAEFQATPGSLNRVNILSASPVASGQVQFAIDVALP